MTTSKTDGQEGSGIRRATRWAGLGCSLLACLPATGFADDNDSLAEVVVQAQRRTENAQEIPITITNLTADTMASVGITSAASLQIAVPGLVVASTQGAFQPRLRGVGTTFFGPGIENPVALYVDNVYYASQLMAPTDMSDVAQVSVLKGPQGTLFGRNSTGGVLQLSTLQPAPEFAAQVKTELDNYLTSRNFLYVNGAVANGLNANLSLKYTAQGDGWGRNLVNGDAIDKIKSDFSVRNRWDWKPADNTEVGFNLDYSLRSDTLGPNYYVPQVAGFTGFLPALGVTQFSGNPYDVTNWVTTHNELHQGGGSIQITQGVGDLHLVSISAYRQFTFQNFSAADATLSPESGVSYKTKGNQFSQEIQLLSADTAKIKWLLGLYYFRSSDRLDPMNLLYYDFYSEIFYGGGPTDVANELFNVGVSTKSYAGFAQATAELNAGTHLTVGARYTNERREINGQVNNFLDGVSFPAFDATLAGRDTESKPTWRLALDHNWNDLILGYVSYNRGFKSGGYNAFTASAQSYKAETVDTYEVGVKTEWLDRRLRINPSIFYSKYDNMQLLEIVGCCLSATNAAKSKIYGVDLDGQWRVTEAFSLNGGLEYLHTRFGTFPNDQTSVPIPGGGVNTVIEDGSGRRVPLAPTIVVDFSADYRVAMGPGSVDFNVTDSYNSGYYWEPDNVAHEGGYSMTNASATWTSTGDHWSVGLFGRNLGGKVIPTTLSAAAPVSYLASNGNPPRTYGISARYRFGGDK